MTKPARQTAIALVLLAAASQAHAATCEETIARVQAQVDKAIDRQAGSGPWQPQSLSALRGRQPTPGSIARAEGTGGARFDEVLAALDRARAAEFFGNEATCNSEVATARALLRQHRR